jgi:hypothetical protein
VRQQTSVKTAVSSDFHRFQSRRLARSQGGITFHLEQTPSSEDARRYTLARPALRSNAQLGPFFQSHLNHTRAFSTNAAICTNSTLGRTP